MAAAALGRLAAKRLGGSGALREAAVSRLAQRRALPRFTHTEAASSESEGVLMKRIDKRKEELYDLMTEAHVKYGTDRDAKLFERLSGHIQPRPGDPTWISNQKSTRIDERLRVSGIIFCGSGLFYLGSKAFSLPN